MYTVELSIKDFVVEAKESRPDVLMLSRPTSRNTKVKSKRYGLLRCAPERTENRKQ